MGGGLWFWAKGVLVESGGLGVSRNFPGKSSPSSPSQPFSPLFLPLDHYLQFFLPSNAFLQHSRSGLYQPLLPPLPSFPPPILSFSLQPLLSPLSDPLRTLRNPSIGSPKVPKRPFLGLFRGFHPTLQKG